MLADKRALARLCRNSFFPIPSQGQLYRVGPQSCGCMRLALDFRRPEKSEKAAVPANPVACTNACDKPRELRKGNTVTHSKAALEVPIIRL